MKLWTIKPVDVYKNILKEGFYTCDENLSELLEDENVKNAYDWLIQKMEQKVGKGTVKYPVWAWYTNAGKRKKPDLRRAGYATRGEQCVCIELEIPDDKVFLSKFDSWNVIMMNSYLSDDDVEWEKFEKLPEDKKQEEKIKSWDKVLVAKEEDCEEDIQATFWEFRKEDIKKVQFFIAR